jgi:hypothetical protein
LRTDFSFTTPFETVMGVVTGVQDNATSAATSVQVTSNTAGFGIGEYIGFPFIPINSFTVAGGFITAFVFEAFGSNNSPPAVTCCSLGLSSLFGSSLDNSPNIIHAFQVPVIFTPVPVPGPGPVAGAAGLPGLIAYSGSWPPGLVAWTPEISQEPIGCSPSCVIAIPVEEERPDQRAGPQD